MTDASLFKVYIFQEFVLAFNKVRFYFFFKWFPSISSVFMGSESHRDLQL